MQSALVDPDTISAVMKKDPAAMANAAAYLAQHHHLTISLMTRYEILRGLKTKGASSQAIWR